MIYSAEAKRAIFIMKKLRFRTVIFIENLFCQKVCNKLNEQGVTIAGCCFDVTRKKTAILIDCNNLGDLKAIEGMATVSPQDEIEKNVTLYFGKEWL